MKPSLRNAIIKASIILIPSYGAAFLTGEMIYVVPTLAAAGIFAATIENRDINSYLDDTEGDGDGDGDAGNTTQVGQSFDEG